MKRTYRLVVGVALAFFIMVMLPAIYLAVLLVFIPETFRGFLFGFAVLTILLAIILLLLSYYFQKRKKIWIISAIAGISGILFFLICYFLTPDGKVPPDSSVRSVFSGTAQYQRYSMANLVPEIDQLNLGTYVFPLLDPYIDNSNSSRIREVFLKQYREMRYSGEFDNLGSVLNLCYQDILIGERSTGHFYEYIPNYEKPLPVIIFIHGSLGNFKGYLWCWKKFADKNKFAVIAPSFGEGNWHRKGGVEEILKAVYYCKMNPKLDANQIFLVGLSNGGRGISRVLADRPEVSFKGIIFLSAIMENDIVLSDNFINNCQDKKILVLHGEEDRRIPVEYIYKRVKKLKQAGINVKAKFYKKEDHFLMFSSWGKLGNDIETWLQNKQ